MINFNGNEKLIVYHINKTSIDLDVDIDRDKQHITRLDKMYICNKQQILSNTEAELKKCIAIKKRVFIF